jgi:ABC-type amino acid transport substrate-binding protein
LRISQSQLPRERYITPERRRALQLLASSPYGVAAELLVLAHEFSRDMLAGLVVAGLATVVAETLKADGPTIKIERVRITDAGRRAIEG